MPSRSGRRFLLVALLGLAAAACTTPTSGNPKTSGTTTDAVSNTSTPSSTASPRPREIRLDGIDPCKVLSADQMRQLAVVPGERNDNDLVDTGDVPICEYSNNASPRFSYGFGLISTKGIDHWSGGGNVDVTETSVSGYPAVELMFTGTSDVMCSVAVDVADGQQLFVDFHPVGQKPSQEQMCQNVKKAAELALVTLPTLA